MEIQFSYYIVSPESIESGIFHDYGIYNPITNILYSYENTVHHEIRLEHIEYCFSGSLDEALKHAVRLKCNISDYHPNPLKQNLSFSTAVKFHWYSLATAICYNVRFEDTTPEEFDYVSLRLNEISYPQNWFNKLFVTFH